MRRLYESLLDDEDELMDRTDDTLLAKELNDPTSEFRKLVRVDYVNSYKQGRSIPGEPIKFENKILKFNSVGTDKLGIMIESRLYDKSLNDFCNGIKSLESNIGGVQINSGGKVLDDKLICKNISAPGIALISKDIKNINLNIIPGTDRPYLKIISIFDDIHVSNTTMVNSTTFLFGIQFTNVPVLKNVKSKGFHRIRVYDPGLFDQVDPIWDKVFDWSYVGESISGPRKINNIKKLVATANNFKRYAPALGNNLYKLKEGFKLTDLIDISGIKGLDYINIENNHVTIMFARDLNIIREHAVITKTLCGLKKPIGLDHIINNFDIPQTADGWYCLIFKND